MANVQIPWDCVEYKSIWEAEYAVGFPILIPSVLGTETIRRIAVIHKDLVDIRYANDIVYRTSTGTDDISGDYTQYEEESTFDEEDYHVTAKGVYGRIFLATWTDGTYCYSINVPHGVSLENIKELIGSLTQVNGNGQTCDAALPNPVVEYSYIFEAEYAAGFGIPVPTVLGTENIEHIYVISGKVAELIYKNDIVYRVAPGEGDISGVYQTYPYTETFTEGIFHVTAKGNVDLFYLSLWTCSKMSWSLYCPHGIHKQSLCALINSLRCVDALNGDAVDNSLSIKGGYSTYHVVTEAETALFYDALGGLVGVGYEPLLAATQIVGGTNYRFICNAEAVVPNPVPYLAQVTVFKPLPIGGKAEKPILCDIKRLG